MTERAVQQRLSEWFVQWRRPLKCWLGSRRRIPAADLDDLAQEVFLRLLRYERTAVIDSPQAYLFQVAANVATEWWLKSRNRQPHDSVWLSGLTTEDQPSFEAMRDESRSQIARAVSELPRRAREVLRLRYRDGLSNGEIAALLRVHPQTIKRDLMESYSRLRLDLSPDLLASLERSRDVR
jgi:RNA polymerase sigma-70 factor (ECF subfamily)